MQGKTRFNSALAFAVGIVAFSSSAMARPGPTHVWNGSVDNKWSTVANWTPNSVPNSNTAYVEINGSASVELDQDARIGRLLVDNTAQLLIRNVVSGVNTLTLDTAGGLAGELRIASGAQLNVDVNGEFIFEDAVTHHIGGSFKLKDISSVVQIQADVTFADDGGAFGSVSGEDEDARMLISNGKTLINNITIEGMMFMAPVSGTATLNNTRSNASTSSGVVRANAAGALLLGANLILDDTLYMSHRPTWEAVGNSAAYLEFDRAASLDGNFFLDNCATLDFHAPVVALTGELYDGPGFGATAQGQGRIRIVPGSSFDMTSLGTVTASYITDTMNCP